MKNRNWVLNILMAFVFIFSLNVNISAKAYNDFTTKAVIPNNQIDKSKSFYDLKVKANAKQTLTLQVTNSGSKPMVASAIINSAYTGDNGGVVYSQSHSLDQSLLKPITDYVKILNPQLTIAPNQTKEFKISVDMKDANFSGVLLGGIKVTAEDKDKDSKQKSNNSLALENQISYVNAIRLQMKNDKQVTNLNLIKKEAKLVNFKTSVVANIQNDQPILMKATDITGTIYNKNDKKMSSVKLDKVDIAPNSNFNVVYDWNNNRLEAGEYRISMRAVHEKKVFTWEETFKIADKDAKAVNEGAFKLNTNMLMIIIISGVGLLALILIFIILKRRKKQSNK